MSDTGKAATGCAVLILYIMLLGALLGVFGWVALGVFDLLRSL